MRHVVTVVDSDFDSPPVVATSCMAAAHIQSRVATLLPHAICHTVNAPIDYMMHRKKFQR
jgi:hypothetical protein